MNPLLSALGLSKKEVMEYPESDIHFVIKYGEEIEQARGYNQAIDNLESKLNTQEQMVEELAKILHKTYYAIFMLPSEWEDLMDYRQEMFLEQSKSIISQSPTWLVRKDVKQ